jgi:hypothetical protein
MEENKHPHQPHGGHETGDINAWAIGKFAFGLICICALSMGLVFGLYRFFESQNAPLVVVDPVKVFPEPRLQKTPMPDLQSIRDAENQVLSTYAWVDPKLGLVRIPIDQAIDLLAKKGLPSRTPPPASTISMPTESGLGIQAVSEPAEAQEHKAQEDKSGERKK